MAYRYGSSVPRCWTLYVIAYVLLSRQWVLEIRKFLVEPLQHEPEEESAEVDSPVSLPPTISVRVNDDSVTANTFLVA